MHIFNMIKNAAKEEGRYRINFLGGVFALLILYSMQFIFFDVISAAVVNDDISTNWLLIFFMSYVFGGLLVNFFSSSVTGFFRQLIQGKVDVLLVRPVNLFVLMLFRWCQVYYLVVIVLLLVFFSASGKIDFSPFYASPLNTLVYGVSMLVGVMASIAFVLALNSFSFIAQRELPVDYIHASVFTFALLPSVFYSKVVLYFLVTTLPMLVFASVALEALYDGVTPFVVIFFTSVAVGLFVTIKFVLSLFNRFDSVGG